MKKILLILACISAPLVVWGVDIPLPNLEPSTTYYVTWTINEQVPMPNPIQHDIFGRMLEYDDCVYRCKVVSSDKNRVMNESDLKVFLRGVSNFTPEFMLGGICAVNNVKVYRMEELSSRELEQLKKD